MSSPSSSRVRVVCHGLGIAVASSLLLAGMMLAGCGTSGAASASSAAGGPAGASWDSPGRAHIVAVFQNHCGSCHRLVRPGIETSAVLEATLVRHRKRTRLTEDEWAGLGQFLAARP